MLQQGILILAGVTIFLLPVHSAAGNLEDDLIECGLGGIDERLGIVSEFIEGIRRKLPDELREVCSRYCFRQKPFNCSECENRICEDKPVDCSNCSCEEKPVEDKNCTYEETWIDYKNCTCEEKVIDDRNCSWEEKLIDDRNCSCEDKLIDDKNCSWEEKPIDDRNCTCEDNLVCDRNSSWEEILIHCQNCSCEEKPTNCTQCRNSTRDARPLDCSDLYLDGFRENGIYEIWPQGRLSTGSLYVYCDMSDGGWTVIQRRGNFGNSGDYFYRDWAAYRKGFGNISEEFWIGNENLYTLTNQKSYQIKFDLTDWEGFYVYATYEKFWIDDELRNFALHVFDYNGTAGESFSYHNGYMFTTYDKKNDVFPGENCAARYKGAWWYKSCCLANLNGFYGKGQQNIQGLVCWVEFRGHYYSLKDTVMKIRPTDFESKLTLA